MRTVQNLVFGNVVVETSWEKDVCQVLAYWHWYSNTINGPFALVVDDVGSLTMILSHKAVGGIPLVVPRMDLVWLHSLVRGVDYSHIFGLEPSGVFTYLFGQIFREVP